MHEYKRQLMNALHIMYVYNMSIKEIDSKFKPLKPVKEAMDVWLPDVNRNIPSRNGFVYAMVGTGGCGKSSTLLNMLKGILS